MNSWSVKLKKNKGFHWINNENIWVKGYLYFNSEYYQSNTLIALIKSLLNNKMLISSLKSFNGSFAFIVIEANESFFICDRLASMQLYYSESQMVVTDSIDIAKINKKCIDNLGFKEILLAGYTVNDRTLTNEFKKINAGSYIKIQNCKLQIFQYFRHNHKFERNTNEKTLYEKISIYTESAFERLKSSIRGKKILLPLSGGYDSRFIAVMLKKLNIKDVLCYTYGDKSNYEIKISRAVSKKLGFDWHCILYDEKKWNKLLESPFFHTFNNYCFALSSIPCLQEIIALQELSKNYNLEEFIVIPGYCGDLYGGSYLIDYSLNNKNWSNYKWLISYIYKKHFFFQLFRDNKKTEKEIKKDIISFFKNREEKRKTLNYDLLVSDNEEWFTVHKVEKFIMNALQNYEFFNLEWRLPLWDNDLMDFWYTIPNKYRIYSKSLYKKWLFNELFSPYKVPYLKKEVSVEKKQNYFKIIGKSILNYLKVLNITKLSKPDPYGYNTPIRYFLKNIKDKKYINFKKLHLNGLYSLYLIEKYIKKY